MSSCGTTSQTEESIPEDLNAAPEIQSEVWNDISIEESEEGIGEFIAYVEEIEGDVVKITSSGMIELSQWDFLESGERILTLKNAGASLVFEDDSVIRLSENTAFTVDVYTENETSTTLNKWSIWGRILRPVGSENDFKIVASDVSATVRGTSIVMHADQNGNLEEIQVIDSYSDEGVEVVTDKHTILLQAEEEVVVKEEVVTGDETLTQEKEKKKTFVKNRIKIDEVLEEKKFVRENTKKDIIHMQRVVEKREKTNNSDVKTTEKIRTEIRKTLPKDREVQSFFENEELAGILPDDEKMQEDIVGLILKDEIIKEIKKTSDKDEAKQLIETIVTDDFSWKNAEETIKKAQEKTKKINLKNTPRLVKDEVLKKEDAVKQRQERKMQAEKQERKAAEEAVKKVLQEEQTKKKQDEEKRLQAEKRKKEVLKKAEEKKKAEALIALQKQQKIEKQKQEQEKKQELSDKQETQQDEKKEDLQALGELTKVLEINEEKQEWEKQDDTQKVEMEALKDEISQLNNRKRDFSSRIDEQFKLLKFSDLGELQADDKTFVTKTYETLNQKKKSLSNAYNPEIIGEKIFGDISREERDFYKKQLKNISENFDRIDSELKLSQKQILQKRQDITQRIKDVQNTNVIDELEELISDEIEIKDESEQEDTSSNNTSLQVKPVVTEIEVIETNTKPVEVEEVQEDNHAAEIDAAKKALYSKLDAFKADKQSYYDYKEKLQEKLNFDAFGTLEKSDYTFIETTYTSIQGLTKEIEKHSLSEMRKKVGHITALSEAKKIEEELKNVDDSYESIQIEIKQLDTQIMKKREEIKKRNSENELQATDVQATSIKQIQD